jgi:hypothetical protein
VVVAMPLTIDTSPPEMATIAEPDCAALNASALVSAMSPLTDVATIASPVKLPARPAFSTRVVPASITILPLVVSANTPTPLAPVVETLPVVSDTSPSPPRATTATESALARVTASAATVIAPLPRALMP